MLRFIPKSFGRHLRIIRSTRAASSLSLIKNEDLVQTGAFINGEFVQNDAKFLVRNPFDLSPLAEVTDTSLSQVNDAINYSKEAFQDFSRNTTPRARAAILSNFYRLMIENKEDLARLITLENGKPLSDARGEVSYAASFLQWFSEEAPRINGDLISSANPANRILTLKQAVGPVGILTPWNFPSAMITRKLSAAFAAGCTVVIKPASETPLSSLALCQLAREAGVPAGALNVVPVNNKMTPKVGEIFCESPILKKISFTGSTRVGKILLGESASTMKKLSFELGGNAPFIVFSDVKDIDKAVDGLISSKFRSSGQTCICTNRVFLQDEIYDEFTSKLVKKLKATTKIGNGLDESVTHGPLIHDRALEKVQFQIKDATAKGAKIVYGGHALPELGPFFHELTVLTDVGPAMDIFHNETFGPIAPLIRFKDTDEVLRLANDTEVGLAGYVYSSDISNLFKVAEQLGVGMVGANTGLISEAALPFGGVKQSGFGREGSKYGVDEYTVLKSIVLNVKD
ncbi:DEKNAAC100692 [Brettanomyces naardenensis]|uniref:Succinate-semialdehyde dehydrogenase, mitochondrial n=1 Tax=Brettanomyces naardenensis TaxID=13370 RepID=A0A448YGE7_BRENA|nr:DEKNAAC100692 [Brettanomyces naardenensis]